MSNTLHQTILTQLGGNRFSTMTGAKMFSTSGNNLAFRLPSNFATGGINYVNIVLNERDLYDVTFGKIRGTSYKIVKTSEDVYADMLTDLFTRTTGLEVSMGSAFARR